MHKENRQSPKCILLTTALKNAPSSNSSEFYNSPKPLQLESDSSKPNKPPNVRGVKLQWQKDMQAIKAELNECMVTMNYEQKRNNTLRSLIAIHQGQMQSMMQHDKRGQQAEMQTNDKLSRKIEYDMEQILQKHNEQVAKINSLKEQSACARSDRVVFSNLFRKIEKEIKQHQDLYRETIIRTEIMRQSKETRTSQDRNRFSAEETDCKDENTPPNIPSKPKLPNDYSAPLLFLTNPADKVVARSNLKKLSERPGRHHHSRRQQETAMNNLLLGIDEVETNTARMLKTVECSSFDQTLTYYSSLQHDNRLLMEQISQEDRRIDYLQEEVQRLRGEKNISEILEHRQLALLQTMPSMRKLRSLHLLKTINTEENEPETTPSDDQILHQVISLLDMTPQPQQQPDLTASEFLTEMELRIDRLTTNKQSQHTDSSGQTAKCESLQLILSKMERYDACERILSRKQFAGEYLREMAKTRKLPRSKK